MRSSHEIPHVLLVRVLESSGPYAAGQVLSLALASPDAGRVAAAGDFARSSEAPRGMPLVPENVPVTVTYASGLFEVDDILALWFVDPRIVRIARTEGATRTEAAENLEQIDDRPAATSALTEPSQEPPLSSIAVASPSRPFSAAPPQDSNACGVRVRLHWTPERARRFVQVVDRLFTADRLGWYRHVFAMRLLVPDEITTGDARADIDATNCLHEVRVAAVEVLGRPLLAAFMPNFSVNPDWLDAIDAPLGARALASLRSIITEGANDQAAAPREFPEAKWTVGTVTRRELAEVPHGSAEAILPVLIPSISPAADLTERLSEYRSALIEIFAQTAASSETVRLTRMSQPNHLLDDRLWQLVGIVSATYGGPAVA